MAMVPGPLVGVLVDSGLYLGRPRLLLVPMGVRLPAGVQLVASLGAGECPSRGRRSVCAAAAGNGISSGVLLPDYAYASSGAGLFFGSAASGISSVATAAGSRAAAGRASHSHGGIIVVAATAGLPADGGVDDDPTPAEIDEEEKWIKDKEQWMKDGEKYILGWNAEEAKAQTGNRYQEWLLPPREEDGVSNKEVTATVTTMFTREHVLQLIRDFNPMDDVATETFLVCKEKFLTEFFGRTLICGASLLDHAMIARPPSSQNFEALATIGKELKVAAVECQKGSLQSESLDRALVAIKRLRATSLELPEDCLDRLDIRARLPQRPRRDFAVDDTEQAMTYFILMAAYTQDVMEALLKDLYNGRPATRGYY